MENNNCINNEKSIEGMTGKLDTSLGSLANHMHVLSLGTPSSLREKKFNVHAWSTPLKSIENLQQQQRCRSVGGDRTDKMDANATLPVAKSEEDDAIGDSLTNVTDLLPDQSLFEETSDFIEYCLMFPAASNGSPVSDTTAATVSPAQPSTHSSMVLDPPAGSYSLLSVSQKKEVVNEIPLKGACSGSSEIDLPIMPLDQSPVLGSDTDSFVLHVSKYDHSVLNNVELPSYMAQMPDHLPRLQRVDEQSEKWPIMACSDSGSDNNDCICDKHGADSDTNLTLSQNGEGSENPFVQCQPHNHALLLANSLTTDFHTHLAIDHVTSSSSEPLSCGNAPEGDSEMGYDKVVNVVPDNSLSVQCADMNSGVKLICECDSGENMDHLIGQADGDQKEVVLETDVVTELDGAYETVVGLQSPPNTELNLKISRLSLSLSSCAMQINHLSMSNESETSSASVIADENDKLEHLSGVSPSGLINVGGKRAEVDAVTELHNDELSVATAMAHMNHLSDSGITFAEDPNQTSFYNDEEVEVIQPELIIENSTAGDMALLIDNCHTSLHNDSTEDVHHIQNIDPKADIRGTDGTSNVSVGRVSEAKLTKRVTADLSVCSWMSPDDENDDESSSTCDKREFASTPSCISSLPSCEGIDDAAEFANDVSIQSADSLAVDVQGLSLATPPSNTDACLFTAAISSILTPPTSETDSSLGGVADDIETCAKNTVAIADVTNVHAEVDSLTGAFVSDKLITETCDNSLDDVLKVASTKSSDCYEDCVDSLPPSFTVVEEDSKTILPQDSKYERSFINDDSERKESKCSDNQVEKKCNSPRQSSNIVPLDDAVIALTSTQRSPSKHGDFLSELPSTPLSSRCGHRKSVEVADECAEVCDLVHAAASTSAVSTNEPVTRVQSEKLVSLLSTPASNVDQQRGLDLQMDKLSRVCDSMNRLMSLCTPMKDARTQSRLPVNPFRCENVGNESQKIVFDFPTNLLDVSIGMLENMTALIAPAKPASSNVSSSDQNVASDLVLVTETPKDVHTRSNQTFSSLFVNSSRLNVSDKNTRLLEENANLKNDIEEYKRKYGILQDEYELLQKTAFALHANENTLKKALEEREDEIRESTNKYLLLKECTNELITSRNKVLDQYEEELRSKEEELRKLKKSL